MKAIPTVFAAISVSLWLVLMVWLFFSTPDWFFVPFAGVATFLYLNLVSKSA